jgi:zinc protease
MNRDFMKNIRCALAAGLLGLFCIAGIGIAQTPDQAPKTSGQKEAPKGPSGVVPPGVKLDAKMPEGAPAKTFHFPKAATKILPNGLQVFVVTDHREPAVAARLVLTYAGSIRDPEAMPGVASMTAAMLTQGTQKRDAQQIAQTIDFVGGSLNANADADGSYITLDVVSKDLGLGLDLMSDVTLNPSFRNEELDRQREQLLSGLRVQYSDASYLATAVFRREVLAGSGYALPDEGTPDSVKKYGHDDLVKFHDTYYVPNKALLAFAGDITPEAAFAAAEKYFGDWKQKDVPTPRMAMPTATAGMRVFIVDKPDAVQTEIRAGHLGIPRNNSDYIPLYVTNRIFGGGYNSRLNTEVRINKGLTYGANSAFNTFRYTGLFSAGTYTRTEATVEATKLVVDLIAKMSDGSVTPKELDFARDYLAGVYPIQSETAEQVTGRVLTVAQYDLPADYNDTYQKQVLAVGTDQVKEMAQRYFDAKNLDLVLVGNTAKFRDELKKTFPDAKFDEVPFEQLDLLSADLRKPKETAVAATPESLAQGLAIVKAAADAAGGAALSKVQSMESNSKGNAFGPGGQEIPIEVKTQVAYPDHIHVEVKLPFGVMQQGYDGNAGWIAGPQGVMDAPPALQGDIQRVIAMTGGVGFFQLVLGGKLDAQLQYLGQEDFGGKKADAVEWKAPFGPMKLYLDSSSHQLIGTHFRQVTQQGPAEVEQHWSGFKAVEGIQLPSSVVVLRDGTKYSETTTQDVKLNPALDPAVFAKPKAPGN